MLYMRTVKYKNKKTRNTSQNKKVKQKSKTTHKKNTYH